MPRILSVLPAKSMFLPGEKVAFDISIKNPTSMRFRGSLQHSISHLFEHIDCQGSELILEPNQAISVPVVWQPPIDAPRGYGIDVTVVAPDGSAVTSASGAFDVLERWSQAPRYGFLSMFHPDHSDQDIATAARSLQRFHINIVQFYDWMWRHYRLLPPTEEFTDALGRQLSLRSVRDSIAAVRSIGAEAYAYGAVYGAEPEYADAHPDLVLHDVEGKRISLAELFFIMDISPESPWTSTIIAEFAETIRALDFDGIHLDQYGFPKETAFTLTGEPRNLAHDFPPLIDGARNAVVAEKASAGVIFNLVDNWPVATVAPSTQDAIYIEVWPPYVGYGDLYGLIENAKRLGNGQQVILAAYLTPFLSAPESPESEAAALLATAVIASSGGFHLLVGEDSGILCDPYYPKYGTLRDAFVPRLASYYDYLVRYEEWLTNPMVSGWSVEIAGASLSAEPVAGNVWAITRQVANTKLIHLIDLRDQAGVEWNHPRTPWSPLHEPIEITFAGLTPELTCHLISPDRDHGRPHAISTSEGVLSVALPGPWSTLVFIDSAAPVA